MQKFAISFTLSVLSCAFFLFFIEISLNVFVYVKNIDKKKQECLPFYRSTLTQRGLESGIVYQNRYFSFRLGPNSKYMTENYKGVELPEEVYGKYQNEDLILESNEWGFIKTKGKELDPFKKYPEKLKVVFFGGSSMMGCGAPYHESIPSYFHEKLLSHGIDNLVINAGVINYSSKEEFLYYSMEVVNLKPDIVIFFDGYNDQYGSVDVKNGYSVSLRPFYDIREVSKSLSNVSLLFLKRLLPKTMIGIEKAVNLVRESKKGEPFFEEMKKKYDINFESFVRNNIGVSLSHKVACIVALQPELFSKELEDLSPYEKTVYNDLMERSLGPDMRKAEYRYGYAKKVFKELENEFRNNKGVVVADWLEMFSGIKETTYVDNIHYTAKGNEIIADNLVSVVLQMDKSLWKKSQKDKNGNNP